METNIYKLGEYKITEDYNGELRWEAHYGFGGLREGRCFRKGSILFFGPAEEHHDGFLKLEFMDHLKRYPDWVKTEYYCDNADIYHCKTGKKVAREEMRLWLVDSSMHEKEKLNSKNFGKYCNEIETNSRNGDVSFGLQRFKIIKKSTGQIVWETYGGACILKSGFCVIMEDILFIGTLQNEKSSLSKQPFFISLKTLPGWNQTKYFCPRLSLHECSNSNITEGRKKRRLFKLRKTIKKQGVRNEYKKVSVFYTSGIMKCLKKAPAFIVLAPLLICSFFTDYLKELFKK